MFFFAFDAFEEEAGRKQRSLAAAPADLRDALTDLLTTKGMSAEDVARSRRMIDLLMGLSLDRVYPNYLTHPLRLAGALTLHRDHADPDEISLCLTHNALENGVLDQVRRCLSAGTLQAIVDLTVDRRREREPAYVTSYYDRLAEGDLLVFRAFDKLDNLLAFQTHPVPDGEVEILRDVLCPRLPASSARLRDYLLDAAARVEARTTR